MIAVAANDRISPRAWQALIPSTTAPWQCKFVVQSCGEHGGFFLTKAELKILPEGDIIEDGHIQTFQREVCQTSI